MSKQTVDCFLLTLACGPSASARSGLGTWDCPLGDVQAGEMPLESGVSGFSVVFNSYSSLSSALIDAFLLSALKVLAAPFLRGRKMTEMWYLLGVDKVRLAWS